MQEHEDYFFNVGKVADKKNTEKSVKVKVTAQNE